MAPSFPRMPNLLQRHSATLCYPRTRTRHMVQCLLFAIFHLVLNGWRSILKNVSRDKYGTVPILLVRPDQLLGIGRRMSGDRTWLFFKKVDHAHISWRHHPSPLPSKVSVQALSTLAILLALCSHILWTTRQILLFFGVHVTNDSSHLCIKSLRNFTIYQSRHSPWQYFCIEG